MVTKKITVSIVSHGHGKMISELLKSIIDYEEISEIIITLNIPEQIDIPKSKKIKILKNLQPLGFGENHNNAFKTSNEFFFCVMNPDIRIIKNPFHNLMITATNDRVGVTGPLIKNHKGYTDDNQRVDLSISSLIKRYFFIKKEIKKVNLIGNVDWISGAFMIFKSEVFQSVGGFDTKYFMYCEDADICKRIRLMGLIIEVDSSQIVIHDSQRLSHSNIRHFLWHAKSLIRYMVKNQFLVYLKNNKIK